MAPYDPVKDAIRDNGKDDKDDKKKKKATPAQSSSSSTAKPKKAGDKRQREGSTPTPQRKGQNPVTPPSAPPSRASTPVPRATTPVPRPGTPTPGVRRTSSNQFPQPARQNTGGSTKSTASAPKGQASTGVNLPAAALSRGNLRNLLNSPSPPPQVAQPPRPPSRQSTGGSMKSATNAPKAQASTDFSVPAPALSKGKERRLLNSPSPQPAQAIPTSAQTAAAIGQKFKERLQGQNKGKTATTALATPAAAVQPSAPPLRRIDDPWAPSKYTIRQEGTDRKNEKVAKKAAEREADKIAQEQATVEREQAAREAFNLGRIAKERSAQVQAQPKGGIRLTTFKAKRPRAPKAPNATAVPSSPAVPRPATGSGITVASSQVPQKMVWICCHCMKNRRGEYPPANVYIENDPKTNVCEYCPHIRRAYRHKRCECCVIQSVDEHPPMYCHNRPDMNFKEPPWGPKTPFTYAHYWVIQWFVEKFQPKLPRMDYPKWLCCECRNKNKPYANEVQQERECQNLNEKVYTLKGVPAKNGKRCRHKFCEKCTALPPEANKREAEQAAPVAAQSAPPVAARPAPTGAAPPPPNTWVCHKCYKSGNRWAGDFISNEHETCPHPETQINERGERKKGVCGHDYKKCKKICHKSSTAEAYEAWKRRMDAMSQSPER